MTDYEHLAKWKARRLAAFNKAISIHGPLTAENLRAIQKDTKRFEREAAQEEEHAEGAKP